MTVAATVSVRHHDGNSPRPSRQLGAALTAVEAIVLLGAAALDCALVRSEALQPLLRERLRAAAGERSASMNARVPCGCRASRRRQREGGRGTVSSLGVTHCAVRWCTTTSPLCAATVGRNCTQDAADPMTPTDSPLRSWSCGQRAEWKQVPLKLSCAHRRGGQGRAPAAADGQTGGQAAGQKRGRMG